MKNKTFPAGRMFAAAKRDTTLELLCYSQIGPSWDGSGITAKSVADEIKAAGDFTGITLRINSPGGDAFEGIAILNLLKAQQKPIRVYVDGLAASAASIIAMAGDKITVGEGAMLMIHDAWSFAIGNGAELRKIADTLERVSQSIADVYAARTGKDRTEILALMAEETWLSAEEAVKEGFADVEEALDPAAESKARAIASTFDLSVFAHTPAALNERVPILPAIVVIDRPSNLNLYERRLLMLRPTNS